MNAHGWPGQGPAMVSTLTAVAIWSNVNENVNNNDNNNINNKSDNNNNNNNNNNRKYSQNDNTPRREHAFLNFFVGISIGNSEKMTKKFKICIQIF